MEAIGRKVEITGCVEDIALHLKVRARRMNVIPKAIGLPLKLGKFARLCTRSV